MGLVCWVHPQNRFSPIPTIISTNWMFVYKPQLYTDSHCTKCIPIMLHLTTLDTHTLIQTGAWAHGADTLLLCIHAYTRVKKKRKKVPW